MTDPPPQPELSLAVALAVTEDDAEVHDGTDRRRVRFAPPVRRRAPSACTRGTWWRSHATVVPGRRVQASAGLPGADWWAVVPRHADPRTVEPSGLEADLAAIGRLYSEHGLWTAVFPS